MTRNELKNVTVRCSNANKDRFIKRFPLQKSVLRNSKERNFMKSTTKYLRKRLRS